MAKQESRRPENRRPDSIRERERTRTVLSEEEAALLEERKRAHRKAKMKEKMLREKRRREITIISLFLLFCIALLVFVIILVKNKDKTPKTPSGQDKQVVDSGESADSGTDPSGKTEKDTDEAIQTDSRDTEEPDTDPPETGELPYDSETGSDILTITETPSEDTTPLVPEGYFAIGHVPTSSLLDIPVPSWVTEEYISFSEKTRPNQYLDELQNIVIHYVGNPGSTAEGNREYFESLSQLPDVKGASSHYIVGLEGEILQCIPIYEVAFANYPRNNVTISIEVCHPDEGGQFNSTTYWALVKLSAYLLEEAHLSKEHLIRHYDVSGKECPVYYVQHPEAWTEFKEAVGRYMAEHPDIRNEMP